MNLRVVGKQSTCRELLDIALEYRLKDIHREDKHRKYIWKRRILLQIARINCYYIRLWSRFDIILKGFVISTLPLLNVHSIHTIPYIRMIYSYIFYQKCSVSCGCGWHSRSVICTNVIKPCDVAGKPSDRRPCLLDECPMRQDFYNAMPEAPESRSYADESSLDQSSASVSASSDYPANFGEWEKKIAIQKHESSANSTKLHPPLPTEVAPHKPNYELNITTHDIDVIEKERKDSTINQLPVVPDSPYVNFILFPSALNDKHPSASDTAPRLQHQSQEPSFGWSKQPWQPVGPHLNSFFICNSKHFDRGFHEHRQGVRDK